MLVRFFLSNRISSILLLSMFTWIHSQAQNDCKCNPDIGILFEDCLTQGQESEIGFYIYDQAKHIPSQTQWVKVWVENQIILDKEISLSTDGFYSEVFHYIPKKDANIFVEFQCNKDNCFTTYSEPLRTVPEFKLDYKHVSCYGSVDGEVKLMPSTLTGMDLVWESGERKNSVSNMHKGIYNVTIENVNGCKATHQLTLHEPKELKVDPKYLTLESGSNSSNYIQLEVSGGTGTYAFDWDTDGMGDMDDKSSIYVPDNEEHQVVVVDGNGCVSQQKFASTTGKNITFNTKDGQLMADKSLSNGLFQYDLTKSLNPIFGDVDGDGLDGSIFEYNFYVDEDMNSKIPTNDIGDYASFPNRSVYVEITNGNESKVQAIALAPEALQYCLLSSEACDNDAPVLLRPADCISGNLLASGGTFRAIQLNTGIDVSQRITGPNGSGQYFFDPIGASGNYKIFYTVSGIEYEAPFDVQAINPQFLPSGLPICGNQATFELRANPKGGTLTGPADLITYRDIGSNRFFVLKTSNLNINTPYTFNYTYTQTNASGLSCTKIASTTITVLDYPRISINQFNDQICEKEAISLQTTANTTDGSPALTYTWYFHKPGQPDVVVGNTPTLNIPTAITSGQFIVEVRQDNLCFNRDTGAIQVFELPHVQSQVLTSDNCFGVSSAEVNVSVESLTDYTGYVFDWLGKKTGTIRHGRHQTNLPADSFFITVTTPPLNAKGLMCSITDTVVIKSYPSIGIECSPKDTLIGCFGTSNVQRTIKVSPSAIGPFQYSLTSKDGPFQNTPTFYGLGVGIDPNILSKDFKVYVKDGNGCIDSCVFTIIQPQQLTCSLDKTDLTCFQNGSGSVTATISGGTQPYRYAWSNGVNEGPTAGTSSTISGLSAGTYNLTVTDANNCTTTCSISVNQPKQIAISVPPVNVCLDFETMLSSNTTGGTGDYTYSWSLSNPGTTEATSANLTGSTSDQNLNFSAWCLKPGTAVLNLTVTDENNCANSTSASVNLSSCFDLAVRKRVILPTKQYYPGDSVTFSIEVFNQGSVNALNVEVTDVLDDNMQFNANHNTASQTGNENDWLADINGNFVTSISRINAGEKVTLKVILIIKESTSSQNMINWASVTSAQSEVPYGLTFRYKDNPIDEDDISSTIAPEDRLPEKDDEICDNTNSANFSTECSLSDDPDDEDKLDYAIVSICQLQGSELSRSECVSSTESTTGLDINTANIKDELDPTGNGDGIANGDTGNNVVSLHNTYLDAMMGTNIIVGKIIFSNGNGGANSSNGKLLPNGDLRVFTNQDVEIFGRLIAPDGCVGVSILNLEFTPQPAITESPTDVIGIIDQENLCFEAVIDNTLGVPLTIQWQEKINGTFVDIPGANSTEYCIGKVTADDDRKQFRILTFENSDVSRTCAVTSAAATLDIDAEPVLACNDLVNISLDDNCQVLITPDMVLEDPRFESRIIIKIVTSTGITVPNPITAAYIGQVLTVHVIDNVNGNSCWSKIKIEDKLAPQITCPSDYTVSCANYNYTPPVPNFADACDPSATISLINNVLTELECGRADGFLAIRELTYIAKDKYGNTSLPCTFRVYYRSININNISWPANLELTCRTAPSYPAWDTNQNGKPDPSETGLPKADGLDLATYSNNGLVTNTYCKVNVTYHDTEVTLCGNTYKVIRDWTVLDWCSGGIRRYTQLIAIKDKVPPVVVCAEDQVYSIFTADHECIADFKVPAPVVVSDCNTTTWSVAYLLADQNGAAPANGQYIQDNVVYTNNAYYINDLPIGKTWIRYTVTDACDNSTYCFTEVTVIDKIKPTPVCDQYTVVTLTHNGKALVYATTFDDKSHDNCSAVTFSVRRLTAGCNSNGSTNEALNPYGEYVEFCCSDIGQDIMVELRVEDASGNYNSCMVIANVQDKVPPIITCPAAITVACHADTSVVNTGKPIYSATPLSTPYYTDNCTDLKLSWTNSGTISSCGQGVIRRVFTVTDKAKNTATCEQTITVRNLSPYSGPVLYTSPSPYANGVTWKNLEPRSMTGCMNSDTDPSKTGEPELGNGACSQVAKNYEDQIVPFVDGVCFKILRKWTVIDWCKFYPNTDVNGFTYPNVPVEGVNMWTFIQTIAVSEKEAPVLLQCSKADTETVSSDCTATVELINTANDCTPASKLKWTYTIDLYNDGVAPFNNGNSNNASGSYPVGTHKITWVVEDMCGNFSTCNYTFRVVDKKKPTPYCLSELTTVIMPNSGQVEIWAKDFDKGSSDNCPTTGCGLRFTFNGFRPPVTNSEVLFDVNGTVVGNWPTNNTALLNGYASGQYQRWLPSTCSSAKLYTCDHLGTNDENMSVWDAGNNTDYCTVTLYVQANGTSCAGSRLIGNTQTESLQAVENVEVTLTNAINNEIQVVNTDVRGQFTFEGLTPNTEYTVAPQLDKNHLNGVSTLDLVIIQRHILGLSSLDSPYKYIAADANNDKKVSASDIVELRKLILGEYSKFPKNKSWRFVDKKFNVAQPTDIYQAKELLTVQNIDLNATNLDFVAIKVGDVNGSVSLNSTQQSTDNRSQQALNLFSNHQEIIKSNKVRMDVYAENFHKIAGMQGTISYNANMMEYAGVVSGALQINSENTRHQNGHIAFSWHNLDLTSVASNEVLFTILFEALDNGDLSSNVRITSDKVLTEAYNEDTESMPIRLEYRSILQPNFALLQNNPNPFSTATTIGFTLAEDGDTKLTFYDITGKVLKVIDQQLKAGHHEVLIDANDLPAQGVILYELESNGHKDTKKMLKLNR